MWNGNNDGINDQTPRNYMYGDKVFILSDITSENCAHLIGDLSNFIFNEENHGKVLNFIINSPGGESYTMMTIVGLINLARLYDIVINTFVLGEAGSAASLIAVSGDNRFMSNISRHFIHFGSIWDVTQKHSEIEKICYQNKEYAENLVGLYLKASKGLLTRTKLLELESDERGYLNAEDCVKYGLCDSIIEDDLYRKETYENARAAFEDGFQQMLEKQEKEKSKITKSSKKSNSSKKKTTKSRKK